MKHRPLFSPWTTTSGLVAIDVGRGPVPFIASLHGPMVAERHARVDVHTRRRLGPEYAREDVMRAQLLAEVAAEAGGGGSRIGARVPGTSAGSRTLTSPSPVQTRNGHHDET